MRSLLSSLVKIAKLPGLSHQAVGVVRAKLVLQASGDGGGLQAAVKFGLRLICGVLERGGNAAGVSALTEQLQDLPRPNWAWTG